MHIQQPNRESTARLVATLNFKALARFRGSPAGSTAAIRLTTSPLACQNPPLKWLHDVSRANLEQSKAYMRCCIANRRRSGDLGRATVGRAVESTCGRTLSMTAVCSLAARNRNSEYEYYRALPAGLKCKAIELGKIAKGSSGQGERCGAHSARLLKAHGFSA